MTTAVHYSIYPASPEAHLFHITLTIARPDPAGQVVSLPAWIPGSYMIRDFAKNIVWLKAECNEQAVTVEKLDKQTWRCAPCNGALVLRCEVYAWDLSVRSAHLDTTHAYFNGTSVFLRVHGQDHLPCSVDIQPPPGARYQHWRVATTLPPDGAPLWGFGRYRAADYDELIDHPVEMGEFALIEFSACGVPHAVALTGRHRVDGERLARDLTKICEYQIRLFGEPAPMQRYLFQVMVVGDGYGGLEHRSSTSLICSRDSLPRPQQNGGQEEMSDGYREFLGLCSHEYFHSWNVKRIKPAAFLPYDLSREVHIPLLWAFEGITSYYDDLTLVRCGVISRESYLELLGQTITRVLRTPGRFKQTVSESSFDAWTKFYKQDDNAPNAIVSYYVKGAVIALALDLTLRRTSSGQRSLDDVMRALWQRHGQPGVGVSEEGLEQLASEIAGADLSKFFAQTLHDTQDPPLAELLAYVAVDYCTRPAEGQSDKGGKANKNGNNAAHAKPRSVLGVRTTEDAVGAKVMNVFDAGAAQRAGIAAGDVLIALDGLRLTQGSLEKMTANYTPGQMVTLHAFRRDELMQFEVVLQAAPADTCYLPIKANASAAQQDALKNWLGN